jgi:hypothetical protein
MARYPKPPLQAPALKKEARHMPGLCFLARQRLHSYKTRNFLTLPVLLSMTCTPQAMQGS